MATGVYRTHNICLGAALTSACADVRWRPVSEQIDQLSVGFGESVIRRLPRQIGGYACGFVMGSGYAP